MAGSSREVPSASGSSMRLNRRSFLRAAAAIGAAGVVGALLDACGSSSSTTAPATSAPTKAPAASAAPTTAAAATTAATSAPAATTGAPAATTGAASAAAPTTVSNAAAPAGTVTIPLISNPTPNPITVPGGLSTILLNKNLFGQLVRPDAGGGTPVPDLATKWDISPDGKAYTFTLRPGVKWHNGDPFTADDVKFTFDLILDKASNATFLVNLGPLTSVDIVDPMTVRLNLSAPYAPMLTMLAYNIMIVPKKALQGQDIKQPVNFIQNPIGTGPYKWKEFVSGDHVTLVANPDYWDGPPKIGTIVYKILPDLNTQVAQLRAGQLDMVMLEPSQVDALQGVSNVVINAANQTNYQYLSVNNSNPLFTDKNVRQALAYALDRPTLVKSVLRGKGTIGTGPISPPMGAFFPQDQQPYAFDTKKAQDLLAAAGWQMQGGKLMKNGQPFKFSILLDIGNPTRKDYALVAQQTYQKLGMDVNIDSQEFNVWYDRNSNSQYDLCVNYWITPADPNALAGGYSIGNSDKYNNPAVDDLFAKGKVSTSPEERKQIYATLQKTLNDDQPDVFMTYPPEYRAFSKRLQGYADIGVRDALYYTYKWSLAAS
jgi:peptide/nickel transport system substrate-binding protein